MSKKRRSPVLTVFVTIILLLVIVAELITNLTFTMSQTPHFFGHYITLQDSDDMEPAINKGTAVISKAVTSADSVTQGSNVLCTLPDGKTTIRYIYKVNVADDGTKTFIPASYKSKDETVEISIGNILAVCKTKSDYLAVFINFARSFYGVAALLILPCLILVIMLIVAISRASREEEEYEEEDSRRPLPKSDYGYDDASFDDDESEYISDDYEDEYYEGDYDTPLYGGQEYNSDLERKKSSIADNFQRKKVDLNSPYQQAVKRERTMQFKVHKNSMDSIEDEGLYPRRAASMNLPPEEEYEAASHTALDQFPAVNDIKVGDYNERPDYEQERTGSHEKLSSYDIEESGFEEEYYDDYDNDFEDYEEKYTPPKKEYVSKHEVGVNEIYDEREPIYPKRKREKLDLGTILEETEKSAEDYVRPDQSDIDSVDDLIAIIKKEKDKNNG